MWEGEGGGRFLDLSREEVWNSGKFDAMGGGLLENLIEWEGKLVDELKEDERVKGIRRKMILARLYIRGKREYPVKGSI